MIKISHRLSLKIMPVLLIVLFFFISITSLSSISHLQGNGRVINYAGIVRGASQRLVNIWMRSYANWPMETAIII